MLPTIITDYASIMYSRLLEQYKNATNVKKIMAVYAPQLEELEQICYQLMYERLDINKAFGKGLDYIGEIIGIDRKGLSDDSYRQLIKGKIGVNGSEGIPNHIIAITKLLTEANIVRYSNLGLASFELDFDTDLTSIELERLLFYLTRAIAAGVKINGVKIGDPDTTFTFASKQDLGKGFNEGEFAVTSDVAPYSILGKRFKGLL